MWFAFRHPYNFHSTSLRIIPASFPLPPYITFLSVMLRVIVAPAAIIALSAISTPFSIVALHPIQTWSPIIIGAGEFKILFPDFSVILWKSVSITNMSHDIRQRLPNFICFPHIIWLCPVIEKSLPNSNTPPSITEILEPAPICAFPFIIIVPLFSSMLLEYRQSTVPTLCFPIFNRPGVTGALNIIFPLEYLYSFTPRYMYMGNFIASDNGSSLKFINAVLIRLISNSLFNIRISL